MDTINVYLGLFSVHYQLKINFKADFSRSESHYLPMTLFNISIQTCLFIIITFINHSKKKVAFLFFNENLSRSVYYLYFVVFLGIQRVFFGILGYSWINVWARKIVETGVKELLLIHMYINSNLIYDCVRIGCTKTHTFV
jgi:hypothetical protein